MMQSRPMIAPGMSMETRMPDETVVPYGDARHFVPLFIFVDSLSAQNPQGSDRP